MKITLDANPSDAPCCIKIEAEDGRSRLIQTDWDYPAIASTFGWDKRTLQKDYKRGGNDDSFEWFAECGIIGCHNCSEIFYPMEVEDNKCPECDGECHKFTPCDHSSTDGTIDCKCGLKAGDFIAAARQWMDDNDGATVEDPGYFDGEQPDPPKPKRTITNDEFSDYLHTIVGRMTAAQILSYGDVYTILAEELNNDVIEAWEKDNKL